MRATTLLRDLELLQFDSVEPVGAAEDQPHAFADGYLNLGGLECESLGDDLDHARSVDLCRGGPMA